MDKWDIDGNKSGAKLLSSKQEGCAFVRQYMFEHRTGETFLTSRKSISIFPRGMSETQRGSGIGALARLNKYFWKYTDGGSHLAFCSFL
jgi:hypothetical protein